MEKHNRKDLLATIGNQQDEILRYKTRLRGMLTRFTILTLVNDFNF